jgi:hypothetical protein
MKHLACRFAALVLATGPVQAAPVAPLQGRIDGIDAAQFLATLQPLGDWRTQAAYRVRLYQAMTRSGGECGVSDRDDADFCPRFSLFVSLNGETTGPVDFVLFRLPENLGWKIAKGAQPRIDYTSFAITLSACETRKTKSGYGWQNASYRLRVSADLKDRPEGAHSAYAVDLTRLPGSRRDCAN